MLDKSTEHEQRMWEHYQAIESENHHLKRQLDKTNRENRKLKKIIGKRKHKNKQHYKNGRRGSKFNG